MSLLHYQQFLVAGIVFLSIWYAALRQQEQQGDTSNNSIFITYAPVWLIAFLGLYAVSSVLYGTATFKDTPEAAKELEQQIKEAQEEMTKRGIIQQQATVSKTK
ncbi:dolichol-phosphate mannosyltransferase subunit 3 [Nitzschia inconspicua]|uniref:Dolichol-phosphate mannosyltransferase subunit 3 n=1 Tax=Nitzschia inconspicua TaxID=303405 RepID=A0A9K3PHA9_9STRA|nr:dolichol-phosphate mannosyltransferase subunit 3 [Nitzschia inconspicua]